MDSARVRPSSVPVDVVAACAGTAAAFGAAYLMLQNPAWARPLVAALMAGTLIYLAQRHLRAGVVATFSCLALLGLFRRLLIPLTGWSSMDPLLLVAPVVALFLLQRAIVQKTRTRSTDLTVGLVLLLLLVALIEAANPTSGSLAAGFAGLALLVAPILWFFIGRDVVDRQTVVMVQLAVIALAVAAALYGLSQTLIGLTPWDSAWLHVGGYSGLYVFTPTGPGSAVRAFGTFSSSAEYATFLGIGLVLCLGIAFDRRPLALAPAAVLAPALFLDSERGAVAMVVVAALTLIALRMRSAVATVAALGGSAVLAVASIALLGPLLSGGSSPLIAHQLSGLLDPLHSSLGLHAERAIDGLRWSLANPLGAGTAATNLAGQKLAGVDFTTEIDVTDVFVGLGLGGGLLFLAIVLSILGRTVSRLRSSADIAVVGAGAVLIVTLGQWLNGGYYAVAPLAWLMAGWMGQPANATDGRPMRAGRGWYEAPP